MEDNLINELQLVTGLVSDNINLLMAVLLGPIKEEKEEQILIEEECIDEWFKEFSIYTGF